MRPDGPLLKKTSTLQGGGAFKIQLAGQALGSKASPLPTAIPLETKKTVKSKMATKEVPVASSPAAAAASGEQGRPGVGQGTGAGIAGMSGTQKASMRDVFKAELRSKIEENKTYPPMSRRLGQSGTVVVGFTLLEDGNIIDVKLDTPSRYERLNESALEAVKKVHKFRPIPKELGEERMDLSVPINFVTI